MAARLTLVTGNDLSETIAKFRTSRWLYIIPLGVILGCIAYEAGNLLGASMGLQEISGMGRKWSILFTVILASSLLLMTSLRWIATLLGGMVAVMGISFVYVSLTLDLSLSNLVRGIFVPTVPAGADWVILGLIGTTVVPYNLFLGSGISEAETLKEMRFGLIFSVFLGGLISMTILITGTLMTAGSGLMGLIEVTGAQLGNDMQKLISFGLFAAGFTSAVTAPLAAGLIVRGLLPKRNMVIVRGVSLTVLLAGGLAGILDYTPEIIILAAQGMNGLILPLAAILLWYLCNRKDVMGKHINPIWLNILTFLLVNVLITIGIRNVLSSLGSLFGFQAEFSPWLMLLASVPLTGLLAYFIIRHKN
jgi:Mn2+/Fe2+ NRAMP family transporter